MHDSMGIFPLWHPHQQYFTLNIIGIVRTSMNINKNNGSHTMTSARILLHKYTDKVDYFYDYFLYSFNADRL